MKIAIYMRVATASQVDTEVLKSPEKQLRQYAEGAENETQEIVPDRLWNDKSRKNNEFVLK